jgi:hypothetical protein
MTDMRFVTEADQYLSKAGEAEETLQREGTHWQNKIKQEDINIESKEPSEPSEPTRRNFVDH